MPRVTTRSQISAGGVVYRKQGNALLMVLIAVGPSGRWQLPKGLVGKGEKAEEAALREVREETGLNAQLLDRVDSIEYWYYGEQDGHRVRFHKVVHFFLMRFVSGSTDDHDDEVEEVRWFSIEDAREQLAFDNEKQVVSRAMDLLAERD